MKTRLLLLFTVVLLAGMVSCAFAHSGSDNGEPPTWDLDFPNLTTQTLTHVEDPAYEYKGWIWVSLKNTTGYDWASVTITPGPNDKVAIVEGLNLEDENLFMGNSVYASKVGSFAYSGSYGQRTYNTTLGTTTGDLWAQAIFTFDTPLAPTQSVLFKVYTDNSYYDDPADSFCICLTPNPVPEPGSMLALGSGIIGMAGFALRRRR